MSDSIYLGIEFGSTRIKAVLIDQACTVLAQGAHTWENRLVDGYWTYGLDEVWSGVQAAYAELAQAYERAAGHKLTRLDGIGISAMMHGYLAFSEAGDLLVPFRTWRNTTTGPASEALSAALEFPIPQRWSIAHLYQAVLNREPHVAQIARLTTLAGYVHAKLTGEDVLGVGEASGMFPIDAAVRDWDQARLETAQRLLDEAASGVDLAAVLPRVAEAGAPAGVLTPAGAALLDPSGRLEPGARFAPPEGDAGTGMVATNAVAPRTGNISVGTSVFAMVTLEHPLACVHPEIDLVTTPDGAGVAMVHCNNGASEIDAWATVFGQFAARAGHPLDNQAVFGALFGAALDGAADGGGLLAYNYLAGEPVTRLDEGRPLVVRTPDSTLSLPNLARVLIMSGFATLSLGMRILADEGVRVDTLVGHGGVFATPGVAQRLLAAALDVPITVGATASEGGAWGMAVLAAYAGDGHGLSLPAYLDRVVFAGAERTTLDPDAADVAGYRAFLAAFEKALPLQATATGVC
ncbi:MAG: FGGY-family carbohydrate kinase [Actinomycetia bacterium]|nr:FGGY-family carbohydrate kinase [Actinomycetes bacterium]